MKGDLNFADLAMKSGSSILMLLKKNKIDKFIGLIEPFASLVFCDHFNWRLWTDEFEASDKEGGDYCQLPRSDWNLRGQTCF